MFLVRIIQSAGPRSSDPSNGRAFAAAGQRANGCASYRTHTHPFGCIDPTFVPDVPGPCPTMVTVLISLLIMRNGEPGAGGPEQ